MLVDTIQIVWTHNCEHGVINGFDVRVITNNDDPTCDQSSGDIVEIGSVFDIGDQYIQCGPEQVVAKIPTSKDVERAAHISLAQFLPDEEMLDG
jgi:hypothetical protein